MTNLDVGNTGNTPTIPGAPGGGPAGGIYLAGNSAIRAAVIATYQNHGYGIDISSSGSIIGELAANQNTGDGLQILPAATANIIGSAAAYSNGGWGIDASSSSGNTIINTMAGGNTAGNYNFGSGNHTPNNF